MTSGGGHTQAVPAALSTCGGMHRIGRTHSRPVRAVPSGQPHRPVAGFLTNGGGHTQMPPALRVSGGRHCLHGRSVSVPTGNGSQSAQLPELTPEEFTTRGDTSVETALKFCGGFGVWPSAQKQFV